LLYNIEDQQGLAMLDNKEAPPYVLEWSSSVVIRPHPRTVVVQEPQIIERYVPKRVTKKPERTEVIAAPTENGIILESILNPMQRRRRDRSHLTPAPVADDPRT
jgi:hypothetical protein